MSVGYVEAPPTEALIVEIARRGGPERETGNIEKIKMLKSAVSLNHYDRKSPN